MLFDLMAFVEWLCINAQCVASVSGGFDSSTVSKCLFMACMQQRPFESFVFIVLEWWVILSTRSLLLRVVAAPADCVISMHCTSDKYSVKRGKICMYLCFKNCLNML